MSESNRPWWREAAGTVVVVAAVAAAAVYLPGVLREWEREKRERQALIRYVQEVPPAEQVERMRQAAAKKAAERQAAEGSGEPK